jgi:ATP-dependent Clp protease ATP-binding subunit ClpB
MDLQKFTERAQAFLQNAQGLAQRSGHQRLTPEHLLKIMLDDEEGLVAGLIRRAGGDPARALKATEAFLGKQPRVEGSGAGQLYIAPEMARVLEEGEQIARKAGDSFVTVERLLLALAVGTAPEAARILKDAGATEAERGDQRSSEGAHGRYRQRGAGL